MTFEGGGEEKGRGERGKVGRTFLPFGAGPMGRDGRGVRFGGCDMFAGGCGEGEAWEVSMEIQSDTTSVVRLLLVVQEER